MSERFNSVEEVAEQLQVDKQTVRRWIKEGRLAAVKPGLEWRIRQSDLDEFLEARSYPKMQAPLSPVRDEERRYLRYVQSWMVLLDRKAQRWEQVAATGHVELGFHREVSDDFADVLVSLGVLMDTLKSEGLYPASAVPVIDQEFVQRLERFAEAKHKVDRAIEEHLDQSELAQFRARRAEGQTRLEEVRESLEQQIAK